MKQGRENRPHIGIYGRVNAGKSQLMNALCGGGVSIVSSLEGTTTDTVRKSIELGRLGPCVLLDTAGMGDTTPLGQRRETSTLRTLHEVDYAILLCWGNLWGEPEERLIERMQRANVPYIILRNTADAPPLDAATRERMGRSTRKIPMELRLTGEEEAVAGCANIGMRRAAMPTSYRPPKQEGEAERGKRVATDRGEVVAKVVDALLALQPSSPALQPLFEGLVSAGDVVLLVTPIDAGAPKGRMILPQVQAIRAAIDAGAIPVACDLPQVEDALASLSKPPALAVTDSQVFARAGELIPASVPFTSFSMLLARQKGEFAAYQEGMERLQELRPGDRVLVLEGCTHQTSCDDIGRVKIPRWLNTCAGGPLRFDYAPGLSALPDDLGPYRLALVCGGCMLTPRQIRGRVRPLLEANIPVVNYGMAIAQLQGIYERAAGPLLGGLAGEKAAKILE